MAETPSQQFIPIDQVREGVIILKDKSIRSVLMVSSINFALKSEEEQGAIIYNFQNFLNSMDFSCQILISSRKANITGYVERMKKVENEQKNELLKIQTSDYIKFIEEIIASGSIMTKTFYVVIPYWPLLEMPGISKSDVDNNKKVLGELTEKKFQTGKYQLWQRIEYVSLGLRRCGLKSEALNTEQILELLWSMHHPKQSELGYYPEFPPEIIN
jgi:hypothetical protein